GTVRWFACRGGASSQVTSQENEGGLRRTIKPVGHEKPFTEAKGRRCRGSARLGAQSSQERRPFVTREAQVAGLAVLGVANVRSNDTVADLHTVSAGSAVSVLMPFGAHARSFKASRESRAGRASAMAPVIREASRSLRSAP